MTEKDKTTGVVGKELVDPLDTLRENCYENNAHVKELKEVFKECESRVNSKSYTAETCSQEVIDLFEALEHCIGNRLFKRLV